MVSLRVVVAALAISAVSGQGGKGKGEPDMAQMMEMMKGKGKGEEDIAQMMEMMKGKGKGKGMDGKGGKGGKGEGGKGPPPKEMTVKKARSMMKEIRGALNSASALEAFAGVKEEGKGRMEKTAPMAETFVQSVLNKYEFSTGPEGGIQHAVQSAMASGAGEGQTDKKIRLAMEEIEEKITGKPSHSRLGRVATLDALAEKFRDMDAAARSAALAEAEGTPGGELYVETMKGITENGNHIVDSVVHLIKNRESAENSTDMQVRMNIFQEFMGASDMESIEARMQAEKGGKGGHGEEL